jgi:hypothetical protein
VLGVKVYVVVAVLLTAGAQVPAMAFVEVVGNEKLPPLHIAEMELNVGVVEANPVPLAATVIDVAPPPETGIEPL